MKICVPLSFKFSITGGRRAFPTLRLSPLQIKHRKSFLIVPFSGLAMNQILSDYEVQGQSPQRSTHDGWPIFLDQSLETPLAEAPEE